MLSQVQRLSHILKRKRKERNDWTTQTSAAVLIVPKPLTISEVVEDLVLIWLAETPQDWINRIRYLPI